MPPSGAPSVIEEASADPDSHLIPVTDLPSRLDQHPLPIHTRAYRVLVAAVVADPAGDRLVRGLGAELDPPARHPPHAEALHAPRTVRESYRAARRGELVAVPLKALEPFRQLREQRIAGGPGGWVARRARQPRLR